MGTLILVLALSGAAGLAFAVWLHTKKGKDWLASL